MTIDVQVDTLDGQPLEIGGTSAALPQMADVCAAFRAAGRPIVHVVRLYLADGSNAEASRQALVRGPVPVLRPGTPGRMIAPHAPHFVQRRRPSAWTIENLFERIVWVRARSVLIFSWWWRWRYSIDAYRHRPR